MNIEFRAGIHLGDVVEENDGDLMGDGVNIAARLEASPSSERSAFRKMLSAKSRLDLRVSLFLRRTRWTILCAGIKLWGRATT